MATVTVTSTPQEDGTILAQVTCLECEDPPNLNEYDIVAHLYSHHPEVTP